MNLARRTFVAGLLALPLASGCARRPEGTLEFWAMGAEAENLPALLATLPGIPRVQVQPLPWTAAHEKLLTSYAGNSLPDLGQVGNSWIAELAAIDAILPVPAALIPLTRGQFPAVVDTNRIGNRLMALPWYVTPGSNSIAATCSRAPAMPRRRRPGPNGNRRSTRSRRSPVREITHC